MQESIWATHQKVSGENFHMALQKEDYVSSFPLHGHKDLCEWVCVLSGEMRHEMNGAEHIDTRGSITLIRNGDAHRMAGKDFTIVNVAFPLLCFNAFDTFWGSPSLCEGLLSAKEPPRAKIPEEDFSFIEDTLMKAMAFGRGAFARQHFAIFFSTLLGTHFNAYLNEGSEEAGDSPEWFRETLEWLERNADRSITLEELRRKACKCPEHLSREFVKRLGCTPSEHLLSIRLGKAANLLAATNYQISEIASRSGFPNLSHFCRKFKEHYGQSPRNYRVERSHSQLRRG